MEPAKVGQVLVCENCGVELQVIKACDTICPSCKPTCCGRPLTLKKGDEGGASCG